MEKFALLNLLKALDGLNNNASDAPQPPPPDKKADPVENGGLPNFMYETLLKHEAVSNRLRNKKG